MKLSTAQIHFEAAVLLHHFEFVFPQRGFAYHVAVRRRREGQGLLVLLDVAFDFGPGDLGEFEVPLGGRGPIDAFVGRWKL